jgi:hypothetical protein
MQNDVNLGTKIEEFKFERQILSNCNIFKVKIEQLKFIGSKSNSPSKPSLTSDQLQLLTAKQLITPLNDQPISTMKGADRNSFFCY